MTCFLGLMLPSGVLCTWSKTVELLRDTSHNTSSFGHSLKTFLSQSTSAYSALGALAIMRYTNVRFTYLLTYLFVLLFLFLILFLLLSSVDGLACT